MSRLLISPTLLEAYRTCYDGMYGKGEEELLATLDKAFKGNESTSLGSAYHAILEHGPDGKNPFRAKSKDGKPILVYRDDRFGDKLWGFSEQAYSWALQWRQEHPDAINEMWGELSFKVDGEDVRSIIRTDSMEGLQIFDHKTSTSKKAPTYETYEGSCQWRMYLLAYPDVSSVIYNVFHLKQSEAVPGFIESCSFEQFEYFREDDMQRYVNECMSGLLDFCRSKNILDKIIDKKFAG